MVIQLFDPITGANLVATPGNGGLIIWISSINKLFDRLSKDPRQFIGMVFKEIWKHDDDRTSQPIVNFVTIRSALHSFHPNRNNNGYPDLMYYAVQLETTRDPLDAIEKMEEHAKKVDKSLDNPAEKKYNAEA
jgi:hypothetical protein